MGKNGVFLMSLAVPFFLYACAPASENNELIKEFGARTVVLAAPPSLDTSVSPRLVIRIEKGRVRSCLDSAGHEICGNDIPFSMDSENCLMVPTDPQALLSNGRVCEAGTAALQASNAKLKASLSKLDKGSLVLINGDVAVTRLSEQKDS